MPFNIHKIGNAQAIGPLPTVADYDREAAEFELKKIKAQADAQSALTGGKPPAAMQIANRMQELQDLANDPNAPEPARARAASMYNHLGQAAKTYGFDRGIEYADTVNPSEIGGFSRATGGIKATEKGMERQAEKSVDARMNPIIAGGEAAAKLEQELGYQPQISGEKKLAEGRAEQTLAEEKAIPDRARVEESLQEMADAYKTLRAEKALVSPTQSPMTNIIARGRSSGPGQYIEGYLGTEAQVARDRINVVRPMLINAIRKATGQGAKSLDSNAELRFYLQVTSDPKISDEANAAALQLISQQYGLGLDTGATTADMRKLQDKFVRTPKSAIPTAAELGVTGDESAVPDEPILPSELPGDSSGGFKVLRRVR